jgi:hypothetical protein
MRRNERCSPRQDVNVTFSDSAHKTTVSLLNFFVAISSYQTVRNYIFTGSHESGEPIQFLSNWVKEPKLSHNRYFGTNALI